MSKEISLDEINRMALQAVEMLMNNNDENASANEKISVEQANAVSRLLSVPIEGFKVKASVISSLARADNPKSIKDMIFTDGIIKPDKMLGQ